MPHDPHLTRLTIRYLALRSRSQREIEAYLHRKRTPTQTQADIDAVITYLKTIQLIDDKRFAQEYARSLLGQGKGPIIIKYMLQQKGISAETTSSIILNLDPDLIHDSAIRLARKRLTYAHLNVDHPLDLVKLNHYLYSRGFPSSVSRPVIDEIRQQAVK